MKSTKDLAQDVKEEHAKRIIEESILKLAKAKHDLDCFVKRLDRYQEEHDALMKMSVDEILQSNSDYLHHQ